jgi:hypothetical protein
MIIISNRTSARRRVVDLCEAAAASQWPRLRETEERTHIHANNKNPVRLALLVAQQFYKLLWTTMISWLATSLQTHHNCVKL